MFHSMSVPDWCLINQIENYLEIYFRNRSACTELYISLQQWEQLLSIQLIDTTQSIHLNRKSRLRLWKSGVQECLAKIECYLRCEKKANINITINQHWLLMLIEYVSCVLKYIFICYSYKTSIRWPISKGIIISQVYERKYTDAF